MKNRILSFVLLLCATMSAFTAVSQTQWKAPKWNKFVAICGEDINLRKGPGTNYGKLYVDDNDYKDVKYAFVAKKGYKVFHPEYGTVYPVINETGEWYHIYFNMDLDVYVSKKFSYEVEPRGYSFTPNAPGGKYNMWHNMAPAYGHELFVGRKWGLGTLSANYGDDWDAIDELRTKYGTLDDDDSPMAQILVDKANDAFIEQFIATHQPKEGYEFSHDNDFGWRYMLSYIFGSEEVSFGFDPDKYKFEMTTTPPEPIVITKLVKARSGKGLNMLKEPSPGSVKLVFVEHPDDEGDGAGGEVVWDKTSYKRSLVKSVEMPVAAVIGEQGDYYKVYFSCSYFYWMIHDSFIGYVAKSECVDADPKPLTKADFAKMPFMEAEADIRGDKFIIWGSSDEDFCYLVKAGYLQAGKYALVKTSLPYSLDGNHVKVTQGYDDLIDVSGSQYVKQGQWGPEFLGFTKLPNNDLLKLTKDVSAPALGAYMNVDSEFLYYLDLSGYQCREVIFDVK